MKFDEAFAHAQKDFEIRVHAEACWMRYDPKTDSFYIGDNKVHLEYEVFARDTWEVRSPVVYVWGACDDDGTSWLFASKPSLLTGEWDCDVPSRTCEIPKGPFPKDRAIKFKLVEVDE